MNEPNIHDKHAEILHVYGAICFWHDTIDKVGKTKSGVSLPCCPFCGNVLYQSDEKEWWASVENYSKTHEGYADFIKWSQGKCFKTIFLGKEEYEKETGKIVKL